MKANGKLVRLGNSGIVHLGSRAWGGWLLTTKMGTLEPSCHTGLNTANTLPWQTFKLPICNCKINFFWKKSENFRFQKLAGELLLWNFMDVIYNVMEKLKGVFILYNLNSANADLVPSIFQSFMPLFCP